VRPETPAQLETKSVRGFTMVEILVALVVLLLVVSGIITSFVTSQRFIARSSRRLQAANYARQVLENLWVGVDASHWADTSNGDPLDPTNSPRPCGINLGSLGSNFSATCTYEVQRILNDCRRVTVTITWNRP